MIRLRGHHLLCSLTYAGRGYTRAFERGFQSVIERLKNNETILIVAGPDDICVAMENCSDHHCLEPRITRRDELALEDVSKHFGRTIAIGSEIAPNQFFDKDYQAAFKSQTVRRGCADCQWFETCNQIANAEFSASLLLR